MFCRDFETDSSKLVKMSQSSMSDLFCSFYDLLNKRGQIGPPTSKSPPIRRGYQLHLDVAGCGQSRSACVFAVFMCLY